MDPPPGKESPVVDFAIEPLRTVRNARRAIGGGLPGRGDIPILIRGESKKHAMADCCVKGNGNEVSFIVQERHRPQRSTFLNACSSSP